MAVFQQQHQRTISMLFAHIILFIFLHSNPSVAFFLRNTGTTTLKKSFLHEAPILLRSNGPYILQRNEIHGTRHLSKVEGLDLLPAEISEVGMFISEKIFEPKLDASALVAFSVCSFVVAIFFYRVNMAISKVEAQNEVKKLEQEMYLKRISGEDIEADLEERLAQAKERSKDTYIGPFRIRLITQAPGEERED
mmetsp:Transcript_16658/g.21607  ORF Transcript_16658/g.21607 Transcript_16658/m.21607 type:complete len:194 (+) Transcript_16658:68-649(+)